MSMCRVFSCVVGRGCLLWPVHFLGKTLLVFALLHSAFQSQICLLLLVFLDFLTSYFCIPVRYNEHSIVWKRKYSSSVYLCKGPLHTHTHTYISPALLQYSTHHEARTFLPSFLLQPACRRSEEGCSMDTRGWGYRGITASTTGKAKQHESVSYWWTIKIMAFCF